MTDSATLTPASPDEAPAYFVGSEIGRLKKVLVHRPDLSLQRLTPANVHDLLFDDVVWVRAGDGWPPATEEAFVGRALKTGVRTGDPIRPDMLLQQ